MEQFNSKSLICNRLNPRYEMQTVWLPIQRNHPLDFIRPFLAMTIPEQAHHCSSGLTKPFAYKRLILWRIMHRGCHHSSDVSPLASPDTSHMQCRHDSQSGRIVTDCKLDGVRSLQFLVVNARSARGAV